MNAYRVLGVASDALVSEIRTAYRALARANHPDVNPDPAAAGRMASINDAYAILRDSTKRAEHDLMLRQPSQRYPTSESIFETFAKEYGETLRRFTYTTRTGRKPQPKPTTESDDQTQLEVSAQALYRQGVISRNEIAGVIGLTLGKPSLKVASIVSTVERIAIAVGNRTMTTSAARSELGGLGVKFTKRFVREYDEARSVLIASGLLASKATQFVETIVDVLEGDDGLNTKIVALAKVFSKDRRTIGYISATSREEWRTAIKEMSTVMFPLATR